MKPFSPALVLSFLNETRVLGFNEGEEIGEIEIAGLQTGSATLYFGDGGGNGIGGVDGVIQVCVFHAPFLWCN